MFCAVSGVVPEHPVVSTKSGHLFEKTLLEKYVQEKGQDPISGESMTADDILTLRTNKVVKPRTSTATSIPGLLGLFHDEWDALMLETHTLRQNLHTVRQELSHSLYQHDAACRVIARLMRERDEARALLESAREQFEKEFANKRALAEAEPVQHVSEEVAPAKRPRREGIPEAVISDLTEVNAMLSKSRKKRAPPPTLATPEDIAGYTLLGSYPLHKTTQGGISAIDVNPEKENIVATAGLDGNVQLFDLQQQRITASLAGHSKKITALQYASPDLLLTASADKTIRIWQDESCKAVLSEHDAEVVGVTVHPSKRYFVSAGADKTWCFYDIATATCLKQITDPVDDTYTCVQFHPDGLILGTGTDGKVIRIWEVKTQQNVAQFEGHSGPIKALSFSENGFILATAAADGVKLWDLRKLKNFRTLTPYDDAACTSVNFDSSGMYLAIGGADARVYGVKQDWSILKTFPDLPKKGVSSIRIGPDARSLLVGAADHNLRVFGPAPMTDA